MGATGAGVVVGGSTVAGVQTTGAGALERTSAYEGLGVDCSENVGEGIPMSCKSSFRITC